MSLSQEPAFSALKNYFVCGTKDITDEPYAGESGRHDNFGNAVVTTNGAGPHNIQMFMLSADGTILNVLPGYWAPQDLVYEMGLANQLNRVWMSNQYTRAQKDQLFKQMHLAHIAQHPKDMVRRSHLQGFDAKYEGENKLHTSDFIRNAAAIEHPANPNQKWSAANFKTTDEVMHERLATHGFEKYERFNVAAFSDYGKQRYDKMEDAMRSDGHVDMEKAATIPSLGKKHKQTSDNIDDDRKHWGNTFLH